MQPSADRIYEPDFVKSLFDRCSTSYRVWSQIASFGIVWRWRRQCIDALPDFASRGSEGVDLMTGTGECWAYLLKTRPGIASVTAVDISTGMIRQAIDRLHHSRTDKIKVVEADVLNASLPPQSADFAICVFGMKTFDREQHRAFAKELARILKPGGVFSLIEASDPEGWWLRRFYLFHLKRVLPLIERLFLRGAQDFAMLGIYTDRFRNCRELAGFLQAEGLNADFKTFFGGCATGVAGRKPDNI